MVLIIITNALSDFEKIYIEMQKITNSTLYLEVL